MTLFGHVLYASTIAIKADVKSVFAPRPWIPLCHKTDISDPVDQMAVSRIMGFGKPFL